MKRNSLISLIVSIVLIILFIAFTIAIKTIDVKPIGPKETHVGFASINVLFHNLTGVNLTLYNITDWLGIVPIAFVFAFALLGACQWIRRKSILKVDFDIIMLGILYIIVFVVYLLFETFPVNYRPILIDDVLEASYPSSTTMLFMCVIPTVMIQFKLRIKISIIAKLLILFLGIFMVCVVVVRLLSGVHWLTDIIGGAMFSMSVVEMYMFVIRLNK